jgi:hypothetical protein
LTDGDQPSSLDVDRTRKPRGIEMAKRTRDEPAETRFDGILGAYGEYPLPAVRTLSDEYRDVAEPEDSERVPPPEPRGIVRRIVSRVEDLASRVRRTRATR